jgi:prevent-host-death family protein
MKDHIRRRARSRGREVGVRELKTHAAEIVRSVRLRGARYTITYRGRPVGVLLPVVEAAGLQGVDGEGSAAAWDELVSLGDEIDRGWRERRTSTQILSRMRR